MKLSLKGKLLIRLLFEKADPAGVWSPNWTLATQYIGVEISPSDMDEISGRVDKLENGKYYVLDFIEFQYGTLSENCKPHIRIIQLLKKYGIYERVLEGYTKGIITLEDKDKEEEKDKKIRGSAEGVKKHSEKLKIEVVLPFDTDSFRTAWEGWKDYQKSQHRFSFKSPSTEQIALKHLSEMAGTEEKALKIIQQSMANGWKGLFELKIVNGKSQQGGYDSLKRKLAEEIITATGNSQ